MKKEIIQKFKDKTAVIGIFGLGYVGLPLILRYAEIGFNVIGIDIDQVKIDFLMQGKSYIDNISPERIQSALESGFEASTDFSLTSKLDALIICVPTPLNNHHEPDLSFVTNTTEMITPYLRKGQVVSLESTTYPGTTEEEILPRIELNGYKVGKDIFLVYSPEREDPGNLDFVTHTIPKLVGGHSPACLEVGVALYALAIEKVVPVSSTKVAEMAKLLENIHRAVNIGLVNEMKIVADRMGIDIYEVIEAASTKPFGFVPYYPGPGLGGHCIPIDPYYLTWKAREYDIQTKFIELAGEVNESMPLWVVSKAVDALNNRGKALKGSNVLILGLAYKKNVNDTRESPAIELMEILHKKGAIVNYSDPHVPVFPKKRDYHFDLSSVDITKEKIGEFDLIILATNHDIFDYNMIKKSAQLIVDTRGVYRQEASNIIKA